MANIRVADFCKRLTNRNKSQGDGEHTAEDFRKEFMSDCLKENFWTSNQTITFDFSDVIKIAPSFANEAFAFFMGKFNKNSLSIFERSRLLRRLWALRNQKGENAKNRGNFSRLK